MTVELNERIAFLKKSHLFRGLAEEQVSQVAARLGEEVYAAGEAIMVEGAEVDRFCLIYRGQVSVNRKRREGEEQLAVFVAGDYFGEMGVVRRGPRNASVRAQQDETLLLSLSREDFGKLTKQVPKFKTNIEIAISSRRLARKRRFQWKRPEEVIYFLARKHPILLWRSLVLPILALCIPAIAFWLSWPGWNKYLILVGVIALFLDFLWAAWCVIDWGNDYYIVTNQRALWLEKVIGIYESLQETPLANIVFVGVETDALGRILDYGDVKVRTYVGRIIFNYVRHPHEAETLINELRERTRSVSRRVEIEAMKQALRSRMGLSAQEPTAPLEPPKIQVPAPYKPSLFKILSAKFFSLRSEYQDTITYHKHWFIWIRQTFKPWLAILGLLGTIGYITFRPSGSSPATPISLLTIELDTILAVLLLGVVGWLIFEWLDWSNDIFQVTPENILDIDKTPLGREERTVAPLENILSTEYKRLGLLGMLFNYGTVYITVGGAQMAFEDVYDPAAVQQDIDNRRSARIFKKKADADAAEREKLADWFTTYHRSVEEFRREEEEQKSGKSDVQ